jgi:glycosyltransferase involved in cell wall biosynthesis
MDEAPTSAAPLVSITSTVYNTGPVLLDMMKSVLAQTFTDFEFVLVDDGSTDGSLELAQSVTDPRVRVYSNGRNRGRSYSLNRLTELARGRYIARMDSDDMSAPTRLAKQVAFLEQHPEVDVVGTGMVYINRDGVPMGQLRVPTTHAEICRDPLHSLCLPHASILARREWFERLRYDESINLAVDANLFLRAHAQSTFANVNEPLYFYRYEPSFRLSKQLATRRIVARYSFDYCRRAGRLDRALWLCVIHAVKAAVTIAAFCTGLRRRMLAQKFDSLSNTEYAAQVRELERIKALPIARRDGAAAGSVVSSGDADA